MTDYFADKLEPFIKSEPVPEKNDGPVKVSPKIEVFKFFGFSMMLGFALHLNGILLQWPGTLPQVHLLCLYTWTTCMNAVFFSFSDNEMPPR